MRCPTEPVAQLNYEGKRVDIQTASDLITIVPRTHYVHQIRKYLPW